jgi:hypothetical protein
VLTLPRPTASLLLVAMLVAACSPSSQSGSPPQSPPIPVVAGPTPAPAIATSEDLIAAALAAGSITYEQSLLYRTLALFNTPGLPKEFQSPVPNLDAANDLFGEIDDKASTLSASLLAQLEPYRVRPSDPTSIFNNPPAHADGGGVMAAAAVMPLADVAPAWQSAPAAGGAARVWVKSSGDATDELAQHAADVARVWAAYPGIFTYPMADTPNVPSAAVNPDGAIDFYFINASDLDPRRTDCVQDPTRAFCSVGTAYAGFAQRADPQVGHTASAYLVVDAGSSDDALVDTIAHELAHASQYAYDESESSWLKESTATWVAFQVMKKLGIEPGFAYSRLPEFFSGLDTTLTRTEDGNAYASWPYFLFASMQKGDGVVTDIWKEAAADGVQSEKAVDKVLPFAANFATFAVRNWNQDPVQPQYKDGDNTFPKGFQPPIKGSVKTLAGGKEDSLSVSLPPLSSAYYEYIFPESTRDITFQTSLTSDPNAHVWAIKHVGDSWKKPEDWTAQAKPTFCRDVPDQDMDQVVIVVTNSSMTDSLKVPEAPKVVAGTKGCSGWSGTMTGTYDWHLGNNNGSSTATFTGFWVAVPDPTAVYPCDSGLSDCIDYLPQGTVHWTWDAHQSPPGGNCSETRSGDSLAGAVNDPRNAGGADGVPLNSQMFVLEPDGNGHYGYWGQAAWITTERMKCSDGSSTDSPPSYFELSHQDSGSGVADSTGNTCHPTTWQIDVTATKITGSCYDWKNAGSSMQEQWDLTRVGPAPGS